MKKIFTTGLLSLLAVAAAGAVEPSITLLEGGIFYGGFMPEDISPNGKYVCGSTFGAQAGFLSEWAKQDTKVFLEEDGSSYLDYGCDLPFITNAGVAIGFDDIGAIKVDFNSKSIERLNLSDLSINVAAGQPDQMTEDGSIIVGLAYYARKINSDFGGEQAKHTIDNQAAYWENGVCHLLPVPTEEELGYYYLGSRARCISADGSVIMGSITDRLATNPMVLWFRQPDGTYKLDPVCMKYFSDIKYNDGTYKEFVMFRADAMNSNGTKVALSVRRAPEYGKPITDGHHLAIYDIPTGELTVIDINGENGIDPETWLQVYFNGISDNGTVVGSYENSVGGYSGFILYPDDMQPRNLKDVFHEIGELEDFDDIGSNSVSSISADGRYVAGMGWTIDLQYNTGYYLGYVLDTGTANSDGPVEDSVEAIEAAPEGEPQYYNLQGIRLDAPDKGVNIVVYPNGTTRKIVL